MIAIRPATLEDVAVLGRIHVRAWQAAYRGVMPDAYLDGLEPADREAMWTRILEQPDDGSRSLVAVDDEVVVGMASVGEARERALREADLHDLRLRGLVEEQLLRALLRDGASADRARTREIAAVLRSRPGDDATLKRRRALYEPVLRWR